MRKFVGLTSVTIYFLAFSPLALAIDFCEQFSTIKIPSSHDAAMKCKDTAIMRWVNFAEGSLQDATGKANKAKSCRTISERYDTLTAEYEATMVECRNTSQVKDGQGNLLLKNGRVQYSDDKDQSMLQRNQQANELMGAFQKKLSDCMTKLTAIKNKTAYEVAEESNIRKDGNYYTADRGATELVHFHSAPLKAAQAASNAPTASGACLQYTDSAKKGFEQVLEGRKRIRNAFVTLHKRVVQSHGEYFKTYSSIRTMTSTGTQP